MSFGWSPSDIVIAIGFLKDIYATLDSDTGASHEFREAVGFLKDLQQTLESISGLQVLELSPACARQIAQQIESIRGPIKHFLDKARKYHQSLGHNAKKRHLHQVHRKLEWKWKMTPRVLALRHTINDHMRIIDSLMLTLAV